MPLKELTLEITKKCPMRCVLCSSDGGEPLQNEFNINEIKDIVNQAKSIGVNEISLSGGEPLTYPYILDICKYISELDINVSIYTSGNIFIENDNISSISLSYFKNLEKAGVNKIIFSLHGSNPHVHDEITGKPNSFKNLFDSIKNVQKTNLGTEIHFVPVRDNFKDLPAVVSLVKKIGLKSIHILRFVPQGRGEKYKDILELHSNEILELREILVNLISKSDIEIIVGAHYNCLGLDNNSKCTAGIDKAIIRPDGFVFPCVGMKKIKEFIDFNNIKNHKLKDIINNAYSFKFLKDVNISGSVISLNCMSDNVCYHGCIAQRITAYGTDNLKNDPHCINYCKFSNELLFESKKSRHIIIPIEVS